MGDTGPEIFYRIDHDPQEYMPDFVAEAILLVELKASGMKDDRAVQAKKDAAVKWCGRASGYSRQHGGKPWRYPPPCS